MRSLTNQLYPYFFRCGLYKAAFFIEMCVLSGSLLVGCANGTSSDFSSVMSSEGEEAYAMFQKVEASPNYIETLDQILDGKDLFKGSDVAKTATIGGVFFVDFDRRMGLIDSDRDIFKRISVREFFGKSKSSDIVLHKGDFQLAVDFIVDNLKAAGNSHQQALLIKKYDKDRTLRSFYGMAAISAVYRLAGNKPADGLSLTLEDMGKGLAAASPKIGPGVQCKSLLSSCGQSVTNWTGAWKNYNKNVSDSYRCIAEAKPNTTCNYGITRGGPKTINAGSISGDNGRKIDCTFIEFKCDCGTRATEQVPNSKNFVYSDSETSGCTIKRITGDIVSSFDAPSDSQLKMCEFFRDQIDKCIKLKK